MILKGISVNQDPPTKDYLWITPKGNTRFWNQSTWMLISGSGGGGGGDLSNYYTKSETDDKFYDKSWINTALASYIAKDAISGVSGYAAVFTNDGGNISHSIHDASGDGASIRIGDAILKWENGGIHVYNATSTQETPTTAGIYADWVSALGANSGGGSGGGGINWADFWNELNLSETHSYSGTKIIDKDYLPINGTSSYNGTFYAPTSSGTSGQFLVSNGSGAPSWTTITRVTGVKGSSESTYRTGNVNITKSNIGLGNVTNDAQLPIAGGTMTGILKIKDGLGIESESGNGLLAYKPTTWSYVTNSQWGLGSNDCQGVIRSNNSNLLHSKNGTSYAILDASNYNSYSPTLTGTGASGTWGISISGNADTASTLKYNSTINYGAQGLQMYCTNDSENYGTPVNGTTITNPTDTYYYHLMLNYWNTSGYYLDIAAGMWSKGGNIYYRKVSSGTVYDWVKFLDSENYSSYALPLSGGTMTGSIQLPSIAYNDFKGIISSVNPNVGVIGFRDSGNPYILSSNIFLGDYVYDSHSWLKIQCSNTNSGTRVLLNSAEPNYPLRLYVNTDGSVGNERLNVGGWIGTVGDNGWYNVTHKGGWYMIDDTYVRSYNNKTVRTNKLCLNGDSESYNLYVNGTSYLNGTTYNNGNLFLSPGSTGIYLTGTGISWHNASNTFVANQMTFDGTNVGIGTTSPAYKLEVSGDAFIGNTSATSHTLSLQSSASQLRMFAFSDGNCYIEAGNSAFNGNSTSGILYLTGYSGGNLNNIELKATTTHCSNNFYATGAVTALQASSSDKRLKKEIKPFNAKQIIDKLKPVEFEWNKKANKYNSNLELNKKNYGLIAQDSDGIIDNLVFDLPDGKGYKGVRYEKLIPILLQAIKEQNEKIENLEYEINVLKGVYK